MQQNLQVTNIAVVIYVTNIKMAYKGCLVKHENPKTIQKLINEYAANQLFIMEVDHKSYFCIKGQISLKKYICNLRYIGNVNYSVF